MPLPYFDFSNRASGDIATADLQFCRNLLLSESGSFA